jgi:glycopeptide antibiotics resistance protein
MYISQAFHLSTTMLKLIQFDKLDLLIGLSILVCLLIVFWRQRRSLPYLLFFSIFWLYLLVVVSTVIFPIVIDLKDNTAGFFPDINFLPFYFGDCSIPLSCAKDVILNILLTIPFGFGINFLLRVKPRSFLWLAPAIGLMFELAQFFVLLVFKSHFHAIDINDAIFNGMGVLIGYAIFRVFARVYVESAERFDFKHKWLLADIYSVASYAWTPGRSKNS